MDYAITFEEYREYSGVVDEPRFKELIKPADAAIENVTSGFYYDKAKLANELDSIQYRQRAEYYKMAVAFQVDYFNAMNASTVAELNNRPLSQSIGGTSISFGDARRDNSGNVALIGSEALSLLGSVGLLYRGAKLWKRC